MPLTIDVQTHAAVSVLKLEGDLTAANQGVLSALAKPLLERKEPRLILELGAVPFITSAGLGELVRLVAQANSQGGRILLAAPSPFVADVLDTTKLNRFFEVCEDLGTALARFG